MSMAAERGRVVCGMYPRHPRHNRAMDQTTWKGDMMETKMLSLDSIVEELINRTRCGDVKWTERSATTRTVCSYEAQGVPFPVRILRNGLIRLEVGAHVFKCNPWWGPAHRLLVFCKLQAETARKIRQREDEDGIKSRLSQSQKQIEVWLRKGNRV
jgi:hypothetical protein